MSSTFSVKIIFLCFNLHRWPIENSSVIRSFSLHVWSGFIDNLAVGLSILPSSLNVANSLQFLMD